MRYTALYMDNDFAPAAMFNDDEAILIVKMGELGGRYLLVETPEAARIVNSLLTEIEDELDR